MRLSTRNPLSGTVSSIDPGSVMTTVEVDVSGQEDTAAVTEGLRKDPGAPAVAELAAGPCTGAVRGRRR